MTAFFNLIKKVASNFIENYLPTTDDLGECWDEYSKDLYETTCWGEGQYLDDNGCPKSIVSDAVWYASDDDALKKELVDFVSSFFSLDVLKVINDIVTRFGEGRPYFLKDDIVVKNCGVSVDFSVDEANCIPSIIELKKHRIIADFVKMLHISVSSIGIDEDSYEESYEDCIRYNLERLEADDRCPDEFELHLIHLQVDRSNPQESKVLYDIKKSNRDDGFVEALTRMAIADKINAFNSEINFCFPV